MCKVCLFFASFFTPAFRTKLIVGLLALHNVDEHVIEPLLKTLGVEPPQGGAANNENGQGAQS